MKMILRQIMTKEIPIALITDTHLGARSNCDHFNEYFLEFYRDQFFPELEKRKVTTVIHLGDLGEYKKQVNTKILTAWTEQFFKPLSKYTCYFITGNHDCYLKTNNIVNLQRSLNLNEHYGFTIVDTHLLTICYSDKYIDLLPWISSEHRNTFLEELTQSSSSYLLGHLEFIHDNIPFQNNQLSLDFLSKYQLVLSGHYHKRVNITDTVRYIGNPYPITWGDYGQERGFSLLYPSTGELEFIINPRSLFKKIKYESSLLLDEYDIETCNNKHVIVYITELSLSKQLDKLLDTIEKTSPLSLLVQKTDSILDEGLSESNGLDFQSKNTFHYIEQYINGLYDKKVLDIDRDVLLKYFRTIHSRAQQIELI